MNIKKIIPMILIPCFLHGTQYIDEKAIEKTFKKEFAITFKNVIRSLKSKRLPKNIKKHIQSLSSEYDFPKFKDLFFDIFLTKQAKKEIKKIFFKKMEQVRNENSFPKNYTKTKGLIENMFKVCIENNPNKKTECLELKKAFTYLMTKKTLDNFLAMEKKE